MAVAQNHFVSDFVSHAPTGFTVAAGWAVMIGAGMAAGVLVPPDQVVGRALMMAVAASLFAARVADLKAVAIVTLLGSTTFVGFLANEYGDLTGNSAWTYVTVIVFAAVLGAGYRYMCSLHAADVRPQPVEPEHGAGERYAR